MAIELNRKPIPLVRNTALLLEVLDQILEHPETWNQQAWAKNVSNENFCGTAYCFAGHAVVNAAPTGTQFLSLDTYRGAEQVQLPGGERRPIEGYAQRLLGLTRHEAHALFAGSNTIAELVAMVEILAEGGNLQGSGVTYAGGISINEAFMG